MNNAHKTHELIEISSQNMFVSCDRERLDILHTAGSSTSSATIKINQRHNEPLTDAETNEARAASSVALNSAVAKADPKVPQSILSVVLSQHFFTILVADPSVYDLAIE